MGTRAQFFIGNPEDIENREWLGCVAWDGYPDGDIGKALRSVNDEAGFRQAIILISENRDDFCRPDQHSFPFPWRDDLFLTDFTYALIDGAVMATSFHTGWAPLSEHIAAYETDDDAWYERYNARDPLPNNVPAPGQNDKPRGADSIITISIPC